MRQDHSCGCRGTRRFAWGFYLAVSSLLLFSGSAGAADEFQSLFDGQSLKGWRGRPHLDPREEQSWDAATRAEKQAAWNADRDLHWSVDGQAGEIVSDGHGVFLTTEKEYADFELQLKWKMMQPNGDSGIYLRGCPQVQIWDPENVDAHRHGADRGSGALWNNNDDNPGKWPLVKADRATGEWNQFRIVMVGARVWVWFNDQLTVDGAIMDNYFDRQSPMFPRGVIQLQTHGSETRFRDIQLREIGSEEANAMLHRRDAQGFQRIFNGVDFSGWSGPVDQNSIEEQAILSHHGTIYTDEVWEDFDLQLEFLLPPGGNNGLAIRYPGQGDAAYEGMCELQVLDDAHPRYASLDPRQFHGSAYGLVAARRGYLRPAGSWNHQRVSVHGSQIRVELNGTVILDCELNQVQESMSDTPHPGQDRSRGHLGLAGHGDPVRFRNLEVRPR